MKNTPNAMLDIVYEDTRWDLSSTKVTSKRAISAALDAVNEPSDLFEVCILFCDDPRIADLNTEFRGKPTPTNVLSWPDHDLAPLMEGEMPASPPRDDPFENSLGNIAISYDTCKREADQQNIPFEQHVTHLLIHGTLHLLGYDHETDKDAELMERIEVKALATLGFPNPY